MDRAIFSARQLRCRQQFRPLGVSALLTENASDIAYLSGFEGEDSALLISRKAVTLITDGRYDEQARAQVRGVRIVVRKEAMSQAMVKQIRALPLWLGTGVKQYQPGETAVAEKLRYWA